MGSCRASVASLSAAIVAAAACSSFSDDVPADPQDGGGDTPIDPGSEASTDAPADVNDGGPPAIPYVVLAKDRANITGVAVNGALVYLSENRDGGLISTVPIEGGDVTTIVTGAGAPTNILTSDLDIFWTDPVSSQVKKTALNGVGTASVNLAGAPPRGFAFGNDRLIVIASGATSALLEYINTLGPTGNATTTIEAPIDVVMRGTSFYWTEPIGGLIVAGQLGASGSSTLQAGEMGCKSIAANTFGVYWTKPNAVVSKRGSNGPKNMASGQSGPFSLAADDRGVYWLTTDGYLRAGNAEADDVVPQNVAKGFKVDFPDDRLQAIALAPTYVVWVTSDGQVLRIGR